METSHNHHPRSEQGFTLIEIIAVLVIVAILMGIALPSYTDFVMKSKRSDAMSALMDTANRQEQYMLDHNSYTTDMKALGFTTDPMLSPDGNYTIAAVAGPTGIKTSYSLSATAVVSSQQVNDSKCGTFILTSTGARTASGTGSNCW